MNDKAQSQVSLQECAEITERTVIENIRLREKILILEEALSKIVESGSGVPDPTYEVDVAKSALVLANAVR